MTEKTETDQAETAAETETETSRGRGRPSIAELNAREAELARREAELAAAEENVRLLTLAAMDRGLSIDPPPADLLEPAKPQGTHTANVAGRSGNLRSGGARSDDITVPVRVQRRYRGGEMPNEFHIPPEQIPPGTSYQWNNHTVFGQENPSYSAYMQMQGWQPVHSSRHPHLCPVGYEGPIIVKGQILMERPQELTNEALQEELDKARGEVSAKEEQLYGTPPGTLPRARANGSNEFIAIDKEIVQGTPTKANYQYEPGGVIE